MKSRILTLIFVLVSFSFGQTPTTVPELRHRVTDETATLSSGEQQQLEQKLAGFEKETSTQIVVLIIPTTGGEDIFDYAQAVAGKNQIGQKGKNNGVVLLVAKDDHRVRIHPGYGLEGAMPDAICDQIIRHIITPKFRDGDFYGGISDGVDAIMLATKGEFKADNNSRAISKRGAPLAALLLFFFVFVMMNIARLGRRTYVGSRGYYSRGPWWWGGGFGGGGFGGGSFGGFGGGGGFSGGGGSFGGGGASGSW